MTNEELRRQSGRDMEEARRASGRKMRDDMRVLAENNRLERTLPVLPVRGSQPAKRGSAVWTGGAPAATSGGGIASPLTEPSFAARTYHASSVFLSSDFLMAMEVKPVKSIAMKDAGNFNVIMNYAAPEP